MPRYLFSAAFTSSAAAAALFNSSATMYLRASRQQLLGLLLSALPLTSADACGTNVFTGSPPSDNAVALNSYSYCNGVLNATAFVKNLSYNKVVTLYYVDGDLRETPLTVVPLGYSSDVSGSSGWESWTASEPYAYLDGVTKILNITYQDTDHGQTYTAIVNQAVAATGPTPTSSAIPAPYASPTGFASDIDDYLSPETSSNAGAAKRFLFDNVFTNGTVVAAQSYANPNYDYDWVRDTSLTMDVVEQLYEAATGDKKAAYEAYFWAYAQSRAAQQNDPNLQTGLGEPKYNMDNTVFTGPWGRPQNDGPATAVVTFLNFANYYISQGGSKDNVLSKIYDSTNYPEQAPVKRDLLYVAAQWHQPSFDLWEEVQGDHFYTHMVQYRALTLGAAFADSIGDSETASTAKSAAQAIAAWLPQFWDDKRQLILYDYNRTTNNKYSYKDIAVILGVNHGYAGGNLFSYTNDQVLATAVRIATAFIPVFPISSQQTNSAGATLAPPIGRYPEDVYDGSGSSQGNPWYLTTAAVAEYLYRAAQEFNAAGAIEVSETSKPFWNYFAGNTATTIGSKYQGDELEALVSALEGWGDSFLRTVQYHTPTDQRLSEEYNRNSGFAQGAADLTWSYSSLITAAFARADLKGDKTYRNALASL